MKQIRVLLSLVVVVAILLASTLSVSAIGFEAEEIYESVFVIYSGNSMGSGFAIGENCIVTNAHVIENKRNVIVETYGGDQYYASVIGINEYEDVAVLAVNGVSFPYLEIADLSTMKTGDDIYAIGAPKGMAYTLTKGGISAKDRVIGDQSYIQLDAAINEGNSGGPLLNDAGQVLGMNTLKMSDSEGIGLAIPVTKICEVVQSFDIQLDENSNVSGVISVPDNGTPTIVDEGGNESPNTGKRITSDSLVLYLAFAFAASMAGNILLLILLLTGKKKKTVVPQIDSRDRTDFDIDILE